jgi:uncharacterized membrane protein YedE/YeeE
MPVISTNTDFEVRSLDELSVSSEANTNAWYTNLKYTVFGMAFGIVLVKGEVVSWFRIQEMFRLQSFHMYGVIGSALMVGIISVWLIKRFKIKSLSGEKIEFLPRPFSKGQIYGGLLFGLGWALTGACPGPVYAQIGSGFTVVIVTLLSAITGVWVYGLFREKLPH